MVDAAAVDERSEGGEAVAGGLRCVRCNARIAKVDGVLRFSPELEPEGFSPRSRRHLEALAKHHFWFAARGELLARILDRAVPERFESTLEVGCGTGTFLPSLQQRSGRLVALDAYPRSLRRAAAAAPSAVLLQADLRRVPLDDSQFDLTVVLDVLEHVDERPLLDELHRLTREAGWLLISVPAFPCLWSVLDDAAGHRRRYRLGFLRQLLTAAGWRVVRATHYQALLFPFVWAVRKLGRPRAERRPPRWLNRWLGAINHAEVRALGRFQLPWGSSLIVLARRSP